MALYSRPRNTRLLVVSLVMLSLLTITIDYRGGDSGPFEVAGQSALTVVGAMQEGVAKVFHPVAAFFSGLAHVGALKSENERLKQQVRVLQDERVSIISAERQNENFRRLLKIEQSLSLTGVTAGVVGQSIGNFEWSVTINRGSSDGVRKDQAVVSGDGLVGHVVEAAPHSSKVMLIVDPESAVAGRLAGSGETGLVIGRTDRRDLTMDLVDPEAKVFPDEQVLTSAYVIGKQSGLYPPGIVIGLASHVYTPPGSLTKVIAIRPAVDFSTLEYVLVVTG
jgi:rod shape-determining protein MreC